MIIEFIGVPASGKSTFCAQLGGLLAEADVETSTPARASLGQRGISKVKTVVKYRRVVAIAIPALIWDRRSLAVRFRAFRWLIATLERYLSHGDDAGSKEVVVLDEGVLQRSVLLFFQPTGGTKKRLLRSYLKVIPYPSLIVRLTMDAHQAAPRYVRRLDSSERPHERFSDTDRPLEDVLNEIDEFITLILRQVSEARYVPVVQLASDGDMATDTMRAEIVPLISARLRGNPS